MRGDHPRSRGVYVMASSRIVSSRGSSPLARGLLRPIVKAQILPRIIPARAGFTADSSAPTCWTWDHPRSRGVYTLAA